MFKKLKITCDQATTICDKSQYGESTIGDKIKLQIHFISCKVCTLYMKQNILLTKLYKAKAKTDQTKQHSYCMSKEEKEMLRKNLEKQTI